MKKETILSLKRPQMSKIQKKVLEKLQKELQSSFDPKQLQGLGSLFSSLTETTGGEAASVDAQDLKNLQTLAESLNQTLKRAIQSSKKLGATQKLKIGILQKLPLFQGLTVENLRGMAEAMTESSASEGQELLSQGEASGHVVFIREGSADIIINGELVATRGQGDSIGEMSCLRGEEVASATVRATQELTLWKIDRDTFLKEVNQLPQLWRNVFLEMTNRFQSASRRKAELLQHSLEGILQLDTQGLITEEYSLKCIEYFGNTDFSGQAFKDVIFQDPSQREQWDKVFELFFLDDVMGFSSIASLLPQETIFLHPKGGEKHYSFSYYPCRDLNKKLIFVDVGINDTTIEKQLQKKRTILEEERASRQKIYHDPAAFIQLLEISTEVAERMDVLSQKLFDGEVPSLEPSLLRMLHTLKGLSGMMLLKDLQSVAHQLESTLAPLVTVDAGSFDEALFLDQTLEYSSARDQAGQILDSLGEDMKARLTGVVLTREDFTLLTEIEKQKDFVALTKLLERLQHVPARKLVESWPDEVDRLSSQLGKRIKFIVKGDPIPIPQQLLKSLAPLLIHILRNAVDHAIELPDERVELGKSDYGRIEVAFALRGDNLGMVIQDDGKGIDLKEIEKSAKANKNLDQDYIDALLLTGEMWKALLLPGFSTAVKVTKTSGRGIGLNALNEALEELGGELLIKSVFGAGTKFILTIPLKSN